MNDMVEEALHPPEEAAHCPVCDTPISDPAKAYGEEYHGEPYLLCSAECLKAFLEDPDKYVEFEDEEEAE